MNQSPSQHDPFVILGVDSNASEQEIRQRYLALIKLNPPETHPDKFREIHQAYESAKDPLNLAERLLAPPGQMPEWNDVIAQQEKQPPNLTAKLVIALGNRSPSKGAPNNERIDTAHG
jgi:hypothetical protein